MKITTADEMRAIDRRTCDEYQVPSLELMEAAGSACAKMATQVFPSAHRVTIVCGKGNNGGDGFVCARKLHAAGREVRVFLLSRSAELKGDAAAMFASMGLPHEEMLSPESLQPQMETAFPADLIIDAILGTGFRPPVTGLYAAAIDTINAAVNRSAVPVLAVDLPSGADSDSLQMQAAAGAVICRADAICTFTAPRPAHVFGNLTSGPIRVAPIGSPAELIQSKLRLNVITAGDIAAALAPRPVDSNKGRFGHVLIVGGSTGKSGAAAMAGLAALHSGAGLATVATARSALPTVAAHSFELMTEALPETDAGSISAAALEQARFHGVLAGKNVVALGPGISRHPDTVKFVHRAFAAADDVTTVLDADGLNAFEHHVDLLSGCGRTLVLTPHPGEMARLAGMQSAAEVQRDRLGIARRFAREHQLILVLKGWRTLVALPDETVWVNPTGNPGMATGGTGDVLTGMIAGFLAQLPQNPVLAVCAAVYLHGLAGDRARDSLGEQFMIAGDLIRMLPEAFRIAKQSAPQSTTWLQFPRTQHPRFSD